MQFLRVILFLCIPTLALDKGWLQSLMPTQYNSICQDSLGQIWIATDIGIIQESSAGTQIFNSQKGLEVNEQASVICQGSQIYAISKNAHISVLDRDRFVPVHNSYVRNQWNLLNDHALSQGNYLILPFKEGLAFYNKKKNLSDLTLENIAGKKLLQNNIRNLIYHQGRVYVVFDSSVYEAKIDLEDIFKTKDSLGKSVNIVEPQIWKKYSRIHGEMPYLHSWFVGDSLMVGPKYGFYKDSLNFFDQKLVLNGITQSVKMLDSSWMANFQFSKLLNKAFVLEQNKRVWICQKDCQAQSLAPLDSVDFFELYMDSEGNPHVGSALPRSTEVDSLIKDYQFDRNTGKWSFAYKYQILKVTPESRERNNHVVAQWNDSSVIRGSWGLGLHISNFLNNKSDIYASFNSCLESPSSDGNVVISSIKKHSLGALFTYLKPNGYGLGSMDLNQQINCIGQGSDAVSRSIAYLGGDSLVVGTDVSLDYFARTASGYQLVKTIPSKSGAVLDQVLDKYGNLWVLTSNQLMMNCASRAPQDLCRGMTEDSLLTLENYLGLKGVVFKAMALDAAGDLWLATNESGVYKIKNSNRLSLGDLSHFTVKDGLGSNQVLQVKASAQGEVWFLHPNGLSRWSSDAKDSVQRVNSEIRPYPNPFRFGQHQSVKIANIPEGSKFALLDPSGQILYSLEKDEIFGGVVEIPLQEKFPDIAAGAYRIVLSGVDKVLQRTLAIVR